MKKINPLNDKLSSIGIEAYVYFYPLVLMDITRRLTTNVPPGAKPGFGPSNIFTHMDKFPEATFKEVIRPNFDTLYSIAWLDLTKEPHVISAPDTGGRYYMLPILDMWTDVIAVPGARTSGTKEGNWAVVPPGWKGSLPDGIDIINATTFHLWIIGRTQTNGSDDYEAVHKVQSGYKITPLSQWGKKVQAPEFKPDPSVDMKTPPVEQINNMKGRDYFTYAAEIMKFSPPHITDWSQIERLRYIGIEPGKPFDYDKLNPDIKSLIDAAPSEGLKLMKEKMPTLARIVNGWTMNTDTMGVYGNFYLKRAIIALVGLGANEPYDAVYPMSIADSEGNPYNGDNNYVLHFGKDELPPVNAFWSLTMYNDAGFMEANEINRFAIGDRDALNFNSDGSLDIYIQNGNPGAEKVSNWLPCPKGPISMVLRLYWPEQGVLDGRWNPPLVKRVK